ncbi:hypothetical protein SAMN05216337_101051 [Bradyrhizobium brasilense]|uniref:Polyvalent protein metallopeptidase domain-containing protein n=1 Tax=Bradyrhizobium brasilense TaxID=1419277 RepID=A0A1G6TZX2_9BRAD|nr:hypothetical protein SAMN05216337_101051 [Bradyrhizobium brasilense]
MQVPPPQAYFDLNNWHRTVLHELAHASGHKSRLNRDLSGSYGTKKHAFEELIAEISSVFSCASLGIVPTVRYADYIGSWLDVVREDNRAIVGAASQASKVPDYPLGYLPQDVADARTAMAEQDAGFSSAATAAERVRGQAVFSRRVEDEREAPGHP